MVKLNEIIEVFESFLFYRVCYKMFLSMFLTRLHVVIFRLQVQVLQRSAPPINRFLALQYCFGYCCLHRHPSLLYQSSSLPLACWLHQCCFLLLCCFLHFRIFKVPLSIRTPSLSDVSLSVVNVNVECSKK